MDEIILTGIKPTGTPHIGNYFGAIKPALELAEKHENSFYFIADYHSLNTVKTAEELKTHTYEVAATWLACGLNPDKVVFYKQSDIPEVFELMWILCNVTPKGLMNRAHAYKAAVQKNNEEGLDPDAGVNMGLYNYPILMAADILLFNTNLVPVGQDQKQHVEMAKEIARYFNNKYGETFVVPKEYIRESVKVVPGLDGRKMSKSYNNAIEIFAPQNELKKKIFSIVTDSSLPSDPKPTDHMLLELYKLFAEPREVAELTDKFKAGIGWGEVKKIVFEKVNEGLTPLREKFNEIYSNKAMIDDILKQGAERARKIAKETLLKVRKAIGAQE